MKKLIVLLSLVSACSLFAAPLAQAGPPTKDVCHRHHHHHHRHHHHWLRR
jgi:Spy/CpxP family protein refolding chaperone